MTQFQELLKQYYTDDTFPDDKSSIKTPGSIPRSAIVFDGEEPEESEQKTKVKSPTSLPLPMEALTSNSTTTTSAEITASTHSIGSAASAGSTGSTGTDVDGSGVEMVEVPEPEDSIEPLELDKLSKFIEKAQGLYMKYMSIGSPFEVNVSYQTRKTVEHKLNKLEFVSGTDMDDVSLKSTVRQIYRLFAPTMQELHALMLSTFFRFKSTALFDKVLAEEGIHGLRAGDVKLPSP